MSSIADRIQDTIKAEESKISNDANFQQIEKVIDELKALGLDRKPDYTLPLTDTIGKAYYTSLNKR